MISKYEYNSPLLKERRRELRNNQTEAEKLLWSKLKRKQVSGCKFWRQYSVGRFIVDFYCPEKRLIIELDGGHHSAKEVKQYDLEREDFLIAHDMKIIRFWNSDVFKNLDGVLNRIYETITDIPSRPPLT